MTSCPTHKLNFSPEHYASCPLCASPEDVITGLQAALIELYSSPCWEEASQAPRHADQFLGILAKAKDLTSDIESLLAGLREIANERARAA